MRLRVGLGLRSRLCEADLKLFWPCSFRERALLAFE